MTAWRAMEQREGTQNIKDILLKDYVATLINRLFSTNTQYYTFVPIPLQPTNFN